MKRSNDKNILVRKASGDEEPFSAEKLKSSLRNAGADEDIVEDVTMDILQWIYEGVTTRKIYSRAFSLLQQKKNHLAARYKLKKAILELGPTGYPFEHFVGKILEYKGYSTLVGQIIKGCCVSHEVDVIATSGNEQHLVECKYSQSAGKTVSVQVPLYVRSRVNDIIKKQQESEQYRGFTFYGWVVTNTRFTTDAIDYGNCCGLRLLSWDYPADKGLKDIIDREKIYPVTVLNQLSNIRKKILLEKDIVICRQLIEKPEVLEYLQLTTKEYRSLMNELEAIL
jgi:Holliday junction resolvase-like predicted endonuclease